MSSYSVGASRAFKKIDGPYKADDTTYEYVMKYQKSPIGTCVLRLGMGVKIPYAFHRYQMQCFDLLIQHYWFCEIREIPVSDRKPVPVLIKIALSWMAGEDYTFITDSAFQALMIQFMQRRVTSWKRLRLNKPFPGSPEPRLYRFLPKFTPVDTPPVSKESCDCDCSFSVTKR